MQSLHLLYPRAPPASAQPLCVVLMGAIGWRQAKAGDRRSSTPAQASKRGPAGGLSGIAKALDPKAPKFQLVLDNPNYGADTPRTHARPHTFTGAPPLALR